MRNVSTLLTLLAACVYPSSGNAQINRTSFLCCQTIRVEWAIRGDAPERSRFQSEIYHTPNLEKLAAQGMRFSSAYAPAPVCSPTRISIQTGKSPAQLHWTKAAPAVPNQKMIEPRLIKDLSASETTIAELLKKSGYATAHYGKWHIAGGGPGAHGYDEHDGDTGNENAFKFTDPNPVDIFGMAERAERFMAKSKEAKNRSISSFLGMRCMRPSWP